MWRDCAETIKYAILEPPLNVKDGIMWDTWTGQISAMQKTLSIRNWNLSRSNDFDRLRPLTSLSHSTVLHVWMRQCLWDTPDVDGYSAVLWIHCCHGTWRFISVRHWTLFCATRIQYAHHHYFFLCHSTQFRWNSVRNYFFRISVLIVTKSEHFLLGVKSEKHFQLLNGEAVVKFVFRSTSEEWIKLCV